MIVLENVTKVVGKFGVTRQVLASVNLRIPTDRRVVIFCTNQEDALIFINLITGRALPTAGRIGRTVRTSFPIGSIASFDLMLSVHQNVAHAASMYGAEVSAVVKFVRNVSGLKDAFNKPFGRLPNAKRTQLSYIIGYSIPFDVYIHSGDLLRDSMLKSLGDKTLAMIEERSRSAGMLIPSRDLGRAKQFCDAAVILDKGSLHLFESVEQAIAYNKDLGR